LNHQSKHIFLTEFKLEPLSIDNWDKFENLFGNKGACGNCWCMSFRLSKKEFEAGKLNQGNKNSMKSLALHNKPMGVLAIYENQAVAWLALAPRQDFIKLEKSRIHKPIDDLEVWSIPCTFISKSYRHKGLSVALLKSVVEYAKKENITALEAYPTIPTTDKLPDAFLCVGLFKSFEKAGFRIVDRTSKNRPMVRYLINT
jgi:GNAT superfamily N-acetyltransferase